jgi:hypothetical protein
MSYWDALAIARERLAAGAIVEAEAAFATALELRERSPGRVFLSETVTDAARRLWGRARHAEADVHSPGRWPAAAETFRADYLERAGAAVAAALSLGVFPAGGSAGAPAADFELLTTALRLTTASRLHPSDGAAAARLLPATVVAACRVGRPLDPALIRADLPLAEADRVALAAQVEGWLDALAAAGKVAPAGRIALAQAVLRLLDTAYFSPSGPFHAERIWRVARLTDAHAGDAAAAIPLYRACLTLPEPARPRAEAARVRLIELLANLDAQHLPVPRHDEARALLDAGPPADGAVARRFDAARRALERRSPADSPTEAWASLAMSSQGLTCVLWRDEEPRDVALWQAGDDPEVLRRFLRPCRGRLVRWDDGRRGLWGELGDDCAGEPVGPFAAALLESQLPSEGLTSEIATRLRRLQEVAWRATWEPQTGHPLLAPPAGDAIPAGTCVVSDASRPTTAAELTDALDAGFHWLACLARLRGLDPRTRAGVRRLGSRGDRAAAFVARFQAAGQSGSLDGVAADAGWRLPPLAERPDPELGAVSAEVVEGWPARPFAAAALLLASPRPAAALRAWGAEQAVWRVVLDQTARLADLAAAASGRRGITLIPPGGEVHALRAALAWLEALPAADPAAPRAVEPDLLPLYHWLRLSESHNGDLLDTLRLRPRATGVLPVVDRHAALADSLPRVIPGAAGATDLWAGEYTARARQSCVVAGPPSRLRDPDPIRDAVWGVREGGDAAWVFLDSARIHWQLRRAGLARPEELHATLARRGRRHLSLVRDGCFLGDDLAELLTAWLAPYGLVEASLDGHGEHAPLALACGGVSPDARVLADEAGAGGLGHVTRLMSAGERPVVALPAVGSGVVAMWRAFAAGRLSLAAGSGPPDCLDPAELWSEEVTSASLAGARLVVPVLDSLGAADHVRPSADRPVAWAQADRERAAALADERRLCSLEVNALLACGAASVDVADPRWCRRFPLPGGEGAAGLPARGEELLTRVVVGGAVGYDLPQAKPGLTARRGALRRRGAAPLAGVEVVAAWRREQGVVSDPEAPWAGPGEAEPEPEPAPRGVRLLDGDGATAWTGWLRSVATARERGETGAWLLAVGPTPPAGAGALAAAYPTAAPTVAGADGKAAPHPPLGPVLWAAPETLADPGLRAAIAARPPLAAFVLGLEAWLPSGPRPRLGAAVALRFLARDLPRADFCLGGLAGPWRRLFAHFLTENSPSVGRMSDPELLTDAAEEFWPGESATARCPDCAGAVPLVGARPACAACGLDLSTWQGNAQREGRRRAVLRARLDGLRHRAPPGHEFVLHVRKEDYSIIKEEFTCMGIAIREAIGRLKAISADGSIWHVLQLDDEGMDLPRGSVVRFGLSTGVGEGMSSAGRPLIVASHPDDLDFPAQPPALARVERALALVTVGTGSELPGWARTCRGTLPAAVVEALTGLPMETAVASLATLAWLSVLETGCEPAHGGCAAAPATLRLALPLAELEYRLRRAAELAAVRLPAWLEGAVEGLPVVCDLAAGADGDAEEDLAWLDRFLLAMSLRLRSAASARGDGDLFRGTTGTEELHWRAPAGVLFSSRRLLGTLGRPRAVAECLSHEAERFAGAAAALLATAVRDAGGARLELVPGEAWPVEVVTVGCLLGAWWIEGAPPAEALDTAALAWLADAPAAARARTVALLTDGDAWHAGQAARLGAESGVGAGTAPAEARRQTPPRGPVVGAPAPEAVERVARLLAGPEPGWLVLRGPAGTGRLAAVTAGLADAAASGALRPGEVSVWCPSSAVAARVHLAWRRDVDAAVAPALFIASEGTPPADAAPLTGRYLPGDPARETALLIDAEALPRETRFAVQQRYRGGRLLVTVDPAAAEAPWEHLFLTTPAAERVVDCVDQRAQTRRVWEETRHFAAEPDGRPARGRALRRERGEAVAHGAASLDEVVALLGAEQAAGRLGRRSAVVATARDDLLYVGRSLAGRGWLPVLRWELDALLLPGALEFVAVVSDLAAQAGRADGARTPLLPVLLDPSGAAAYARWLAAAGPLAEVSLAEIHARIARSGWATPWLARPEVQRRVERLVREAGGEDPGHFVKRPLWAAWRLELADWLAVPAATPHAPVVTLATPETCGATGADTLVYLCLGSEARQRHYRVFARATERVMVLYQESSPLTGDEATAAD